MKPIIAILLFTLSSPFVYACSVCGGSYSDAEILAYKSATLLLLLFVVSLMGAFFYWIYKVYVKNN